MELVAVVLEQPVDRLGFQDQSLQLQGLFDPLGRLASRRTQGDLQPRRLECSREPGHQERLARAGAAGDDGDGVLHGESKGFGLLRLQSRHDGGRHWRRPELPGMLPERIGDQALGLQESSAW